ncbi:MAG: G1 family endopeptidase [Candidatus Babeliales bacterium]|nr:G1 family endopeptidase [Candidatus Babeliales bacterium]
MKKLLVIFLLLSVNIQLYSTIDTTGYKFIECKLQPFDKKKLKIKNKKHPSQPHIPAIKTFVENTTLNSQNWSGYVEVTNLQTPAVNSVTAVSGSWNVPKLSPTPDTSYCSLWVGIDGYKSPTVEQLGTGHEWVNNSQYDYAWFEMYPQGASVISNFPLKVGDSISASVVYQGDGIFLLSIANNTKKVHTSIPTQYTTSTTALRSSAEWIAEAPEYNSILPLANFSQVNFIGCTTVINGLYKQINSTFFQNAAINMIYNGGFKALTSTLTNGGQGFNVVWKHE